MLFIKLLSKIVVGILSPTHCVYCERWGELLCDKCYEAIDFLYDQPPPQLAPLFLDQVISACRYGGAVKALIKSLKYQSVIEAGRLCGRLLYHCTIIPKVDCITSVPIHPMRLHERGFNQAQVIAQTLAELVNTPYQDLLIRTIHGSHQASIQSRDERLKHVSNHFSLNPDQTLQLPETIILIDDVFTTGSTLNECAKVLKANRCKTVIGLTVARQAS